MILKQAIRAFIERPRNDWSWYKDMDDARLNARRDKLPVDPPIWNKLQRHQKQGLLLGIRLKKLAYWYSCVAPETLIETDKGPVRIDALAARGKPIKVWSVTNRGMALVSATCPFVKGVAPLYRVTLSCGSSILATAGHVFLTERGWVPCGALQLGERLPRYAVCRPQSTAGTCPATSRQDASHWSCTTQDLIACSSTPSYDEQPQLAANTGQGVVPSQDDAQAHDLPLWRMGDPWAPSHTRTDHYVPYHLSMNHLQRQRCPGRNWAQPPLNAGDTLQTYPNTHTASPAGALANRLARAPVEVASQNASFVDSDPSAQHTSCYSTVTSVQYERTGVYYDMHVPVHENYIAHDICNHNTGTGKTLMSLALVRYFQEKATLTRALVLVPNLTNKEEWAREIEKHAPRTQYLILDGPVPKRWEALCATKATVVIDTYAGFARLMSTKATVPGRKNATLVPNYMRTAELCKLVNMVILDESSQGGLGNRGSLTYRIVDRLCAAANYVYLLNGTPFGRDPTPLWPQMHCVDRGETLGETLTLFRHAFFNETHNGWATEWVFDDKHAPTLHQMLKHRSLRYQADEADLPPVVRITKNVALSADANAVYQKALVSLRQARGKVVELKNEFLRMRQISSGFLGYKDDEVGKAAQYEFKTNPKLEMLLQLLTSIVDEHKAVVFNEYTFSGSIICRELTKLGIKHARIYGGSKDAGAELRKFTEDPTYRVLVVNHQAGGLGLNLQCAKYVLYYESPVSPRVRIQSEARVHRQGSEHDKVYIYDLIAAPIDLALLSMHRTGKDLLQAILNGEEVLELK